MSSVSQRLQTNLEFWIIAYTHVESIICRESSHCNASINIIHNNLARRELTGEEVRRIANQINSTENLYAIDSHCDFGSSQIKLIKAIPVCSAGLHLLLKPVGFNYHLLERY